MIEVPGYNKKYFVTTSGKVFSFHYKRKKELAYEETKNGYLRVTLSKNGQTKRFLLHRLVMLCFHGISEKVVNHLNGNKHDNSLSNLEYTNMSENNKHAYAAGLKKANGSNNGRSKLTKKQVNEIRGFKGIKQKDIALMYGISRQHVSAIRLKKFWHE